MQFDDGRVRIEECPLCLEVHEYDIHLITKPMQVILTDNKEADRCATPIVGTYLCPKTNQEFEQEVEVVHRIYEFLRDMKTKPVEEGEVTDSNR
jgi:hypothetical protein